MNVAIIFIILRVIGPYDRCYYIHFKNKKFRLRVRCLAWFFFGPILYRYSQDIYPELSDLTVYAFQGMMLSIIIKSLCILHFHLALCVFLFILDILTQAITSPQSLYHNLSNLLLFLDINCLSVIHLAHALMNARQYQYIIFYNTVVTIDL